MSVKYTRRSPNLFVAGVFAFYRSFTIALQSNPNENPASFLLLIIGMVHGLSISEACLVTGGKLLTGLFC